MLITTVGVRCVPEELSLMHLDILRLIDSGVNTNKTISKRLQLPRSTLKRRLDDLMELHLVHKQIAGNSRVYVLSTQGVELLNAGLWNTPKKNVEMKVHKVQWSAAIVRRPWDLHDDLLRHSFTVSEHRNWSKYKLKNYEEGVTIVFNPRKVHFYIHEFFIKSPMEYYPVAQEKLLRLCRMLQEKFPGLVLGEPKKLFTVHSQHIVKQGGPLAKKFEEHARQTGNPQVYHGKRLDVDHSQGVWEEETKDPRSAPADMHDLGHFFDSWLEEPFSPSDVREARSEAREAVARADGYVGVVRDGFGDTAVRLREVGRLQRGQGKVFGRLLGLQARQTELFDVLSQNMGVFSDAMSEHVKLVRALQGVAEGQRLATRALAGSLAGRVDAVLDGQERLLESVGAQQRQLLESVAAGQRQLLEGVAAVVIERTTPWYERLFRALWRWWRR